MGLVDGAQGGQVADGPGPQEIAGEAPLVNEAPGHGTAYDENGCRDPSWSEEDARACRDRFPDVQCLVLEGAHLDAQNATKYFLENLYLPTDHYMGVKLEKALASWGDIPPDIGVCTDTVIRAFRHAGIDLQALVHLDMKAEEGKPESERKYPWGSWKKTKADPNIDHRRCPNLEAFFSIHAKSLPVETGVGSIASWQAGDVVIWDLETGRFHVGILSDAVGPSGLPLVVHNFPSPGYTCEQDVLDAWRIRGHFRYPQPGKKIPYVPLPDVP